MKQRRRTTFFWFGLIVLMLLPHAALSQVPQEVTFSGRLVDDLGAPLVGPVSLGLRIFDAETGGAPLYTEEHNGLALDPDGGFSVQLGTGSNPSTTFDASLFSTTGRWLEVVAGAEVLTPRSVIGSVPFALIAQQASELVPDTSGPRFADCGDGTIEDRQTGLLWEKKTGSPVLH